MSSSPENYTLGKGIVYFNRKDLDTGLYLGERDLGNAPAFSFNVAIEKLEHFSSRGGLKAKDKTIISQITPSCAFSLDEITADNLALLTLGDIETVTQTASSVVDEVVTANFGKRVALAKRSIGLTTLSHGTVTGGPFTTAMTLTGGTSTATGRVVVVGSGFVKVAVTSGVFGAAETITSGAASATTNAASVFVPGVISVKDAATGLIVYAAGTDYIIDTTVKDDVIGRIYIPETGSTIVDGANLKVTYGYAASTYQVISAFSQTQIEGFLRFVSDNPAGLQQELEIWRVSLAPTGDTAMIGDGWSTIGFTGEILKDATNHPDSPYFNIILD
jgi:hypothetical protein